MARLLAVALVGVAVVEGFSCRSPIASSLISSRAQQQSRRGSPLPVPPSPSSAASRMSLKMIDPTLASSLLLLADEPVRYPCIKYFHLNTLSMSLNIGVLRRLLRVQSVHHSRTVPAIASWTVLSSHTLSQSKCSTENVRFAWSYQSHLQTAAYGRRRNHGILQSHELRGHRH